jgi:methylated-DNA-[protein]-cysteine S-methyltransferase
MAKSSLTAQVLSRRIWVELRACRRDLSRGVKRGIAMDQVVQHFHVFDTAAGFCGIAWSAAGITRFQLPTRSVEATERLLRRRTPGAEPALPGQQAADAVAAACRYFEGERTDFSRLALDLGDQAPLVARIYDAVRRIGWGETTSYGALARVLGAGPEVARDVGQAMARNPVALIIPCHRVLAAGGKVGGFSAPGGAATKRRMLEMEGVCLTAPPPAQKRFAF